MGNTWYITIHDGKLLGLLLLLISQLLSQILDYSGEVTD
jgi:hypothetical protein